MRINSVKELKSFDKIILSDDNINIETVNKHIKDSYQKTLILIISKHFPKNKNIETLKNKNKNKNVSFKIFAWSIFNHRYYERWHSSRLSTKNSEFIFTKLLKTNKLLISFFIKLYSSREIVFGFKKSIALKLNDYYQIIKIYELIKEHNDNVITITSKKKYISIKKLIDENIPEDIQSDFHKKVLFYNEYLLNKKFFF